MAKKPKPMKKGGGKMPCLIVLAVVALWVGAAAIFDVASAQTAPPNYSWSDFAHRGSFGVGGGYAFHSGDESNLPATRKEWEVGAYGAYNVVPNFSVAGYGVRGFENRTWRVGLGPRLGVWKSDDKNHAVSVSLRYAWHAGPAEELPHFPHEWEAGAEYGFKFSPKVIFAASSAFGLDNHTFRSSLGARYALY